MKLSIVTVCFNAADTIEDTIRSVAAQTYDDVEHILIDGVSTDNTMRIVNRYEKHFAYIVSERDQGLYDAMNKGIARAKGDVIGILNADDFYQSDSVLEKVAQTFAMESGLVACYGDLVYVKAENPKKIVRYWKSGDYQAGLVEQGWMPAHPAFFLTRAAYNKIGVFNTELKYQSDLEFMARAFVMHNIRSKYVPEIWVVMRLGGTTNRSFTNILKGNWESYRACRRLGVKLSPVFFLTKFSMRLKQFFQKPSTKEF